MSNGESSPKSGHFNQDGYPNQTISESDTKVNPKVSILNNDANFQTTFQNFNTNTTNHKNCDSLRRSSEALNQFTNDSITDKKENLEPNKTRIQSQLRESFDNQREV